MKLIRTCRDCGFFGYTKPTSYKFKGAAICSYRSRILNEPYEIPDWCHLEDVEPPNIDCYYYGGCGCQNIRLGIDPRYQEKTILLKYENIECISGNDEQTSEKEVVKKVLQKAISNRTQYYYKLSGDS